MSEDILYYLNEEQKKAVRQTDGPVLIIAGAGSGKTRVLTSRVALLLSYGVPPEDILALTFTKKAAGEMRYRVKKMVGDLVKGLTIGTFHSVFIKFLRIYHERIGFPEDFTIYDEGDTESCLRTCVGEVLYGPDWNDKEKLKGLSPDEKNARKEAFKRYRPHDIRGLISLAKNDLCSPQDYAFDMERRHLDIKYGRERMPEIYKLYVEKTKAAGAMDFDDILVYMYHILKDFPDVRQELSARARYILVDEYQDTNAIQYAIISMLAATHRNITVVGDDSQSIYAFRGARIQNILGFKKAYPDMQTFRLETNYRSSTQIVESANRLIAHNASRIPKTCTAKKGVGEPITVQECLNEREEARFVADYIRTSVDQGKARLRDFAVLYRTNAQSRVIEDVFIKQHIPYIIFSGTSFFDRAEVKDVVAYLRLVINPLDNEAFSRICNRPSRGISDATLTALESRVAQYGSSLMREAQTATPETTGLKEKACEALKAFADLIDGIRNKIHGLDAADALQTVFTETGIYEYYRQEEGGDGMKKSHNLDELLNSARDFVQQKKTEYEEDLPDGPLQVGVRDYLEDIALLSNADTEKKNGESVCIMTSHCSKGLEFKTVFVIGVEDHLYPLVRDDSSQADEEEERRLFYVSITRAMSRLILTYCEERYQYGKMVLPRPSRFIDEMEIEQVQETAYKEIADNSAPMPTLEDEPPQSYQQDVYEPF